MMANCHQVAGSPSGKWDLPGGEWLPRDKIVVPKPPEEQSLGIGVKVIVASGISLHYMICS